jgi:hypothetical protein
MQWRQFLTQCRVFAASEIYLSEHLSLYRYPRFIRLVRGQVQTA